MLIPLWRPAFESLMTSRLFGAETMLLPVAGKKDDGNHDYSRLFARDSLESLFLLVRDEEYTKLFSDTLRYFASHQGRKSDPYTAEEPGKIFHELEGVPLRGHNTLFCACDTALLFLLGCCSLAKSGKAERTVWAYLVPRMMAALVYVRQHVEEGVFWETPAYSRANSFSLLATYWRDYGIPGRVGRKLQYPVAFLLLQAQLIAALHGLLSLTKQNRFPGERERLEGELLAARKAFFEHFAVTDPPVAIDRKGPIRFVSTDPAHALYYLSREDVNEDFLAAAEIQLRELETPWGWKTWKKDVSIPGMRWHPCCHGKKKTDLERIWPWEHAFIYEGLVKHRFSYGRDIALRPAEFLAQGPRPFAEFLELKRGRPRVSGCHIQQWTLAYWAWIEQNHASHFSGALSLWYI